MSWTRPDEEGSKRVAREATGKISVFLFHRGESRRYDSFKGHGDHRKIPETSLRTWVLQKCFSIKFVAQRRGLVPQRHQNPGGRSWSFDITFSSFNSEGTSKICFQACSRSRGLSVRKYSGVLFMASTVMPLRRIWDKLWLRQTFTKTQHQQQNCHIFLFGFQKSSVRT
jgi:hypothetical protein